MENRSRLHDQPREPLAAVDITGDAYDARYDQRAAAGENVHGEADFVMRLAPRSVLDAGCGTGRVARELARRGVDVVGVDLDPDMLATARRRSPELSWVQADLASLILARTFDVVVAAGNVMILLTPGTEPAVLANLCASPAAGRAARRGVPAATRPPDAHRVRRAGDGGRVRARRALVDLGSGSLADGQRLRALRAPATRGPGSRAPAAVGPQ